ncbi:uncharacterized protein UTRI_04547 [Ustilago trichophora]|uniref:Secreted protein n=1 Tax=Ustilago trichophora TaxID=86804 RepID=A0A5C3EHJ3_9BASI|nr:uncharacterized protein UTRI_04547 [Ustilago trichophora]
MLIERMSMRVLVHVIVLATLASLCLALPLSAGPPIGPPIGPSTGPLTGSAIRYQPKLATITSGVNYDPYKVPELFNPRPDYVQSRPYAQPLPENPFTYEPLPTHKGSWWSRWMPWSTSQPSQPSGTVASVKSREDVVRALKNRLNERYDQPLELHPVSVGQLEVIRLPGNGWDAQALEAMRIKQGKRPFMVATADDTVLHVDSRGRLHTVNEESRASALTSLQRAREPTVKAPSLTREAVAAAASQNAGEALEEWRARRAARQGPAILPVAEEAASRAAQAAPVDRAVAQARPGVGWMDRMGQGARRWFGSVTRSLKALKPV